MRNNKERFKEDYLIKFQASLPGIKCRHVIYISRNLLLHKLFYNISTKVLIIFVQKYFQLSFISVLTLKNTTK